MSLDWSDIASKLVVLAVGGVGSWTFQNITKLRRDLDAAFHKIRALETAARKSPNPEPPTDSEEAA